MAVHRLPAPPPVPVSEDGQVGDMAEMSGIRGLAVGGGETFHRYEVEVSFFMFPPPSEMGQQRAAGGGGCKGERARPPHPTAPSPPSPGPRRRNATRRSGDRTCARRLGAPRAEPAGLLEEWIIRHVRQLKNLRRLIPGAAAAAPRPSHSPTLAGPPAARGLPGGYLGGYRHTPPLPAGRLNSILPAVTRGASLSLHALLLR